MSNQLACLTNKYWAGYTIRRLPILKRIDDKRLEIMKLIALEGITGSDQFIFKNGFNEAKSTYKKEKDEHLKNNRYDLFVTASNLYCDFLIKSGDYALAQKELKALQGQIEAQRQAS
ncbi:MAG: hypothetical protein AAF985_08325, partial [Bacteroidota bacterium]